MQYVETKSKYTIFINDKGELCRYGVKKNADTDTVSFAGQQFSSVSKVVESMRQNFFKGVTTVELQLGKAAFISLDGTLNWIQAPSLFSLSLSFSLSLFLSLSLSVCVLTFGCVWVNCCIVALLHTMACECTLTTSMVPTVVIQCHGS